MKTTSNIIKKEKNIVFVDFRKNNKLDPKMVLNKEQEEIFYETVNEIEKYDTVSDTEWNYLINLIKMTGSLDYFQANT